MLVHIAHGRLYPIYFERNGLQVGYCLNNSNMIVCNNVCILRIFNAYSQLEVVVELSKVRR